ncbi:acyltransferase [Sphingobium sp. JS3065]|uniref:acyltransferase family protein n=1 Tax=Sphingobium sp. JS3065 TaxID=2970925 RepID=UPI0022655B9E|nr:acyltransferase [Sphingobium sp. JS3065]UZW56593.1 acyltransferase [Sphingobium sp. JS3065]
MPQPAARPEPEADTPHIAILDGWRGISILLVLATHMLSLGPKSLRLNEAFGMVGMSLFFTLSGFLITKALLKDPSVVPFLIKRVFRILPLAWTFILLVVATQTSSWPVIAANLLFFANNHKPYLFYAGHLWSLSLEMQFYMFVALLVGIGGRRAIMLLPALAVAVTLSRVVRGITAGVHTFDRMDEILAGAILAIVVARGWRPPESWCRPWVWGLLLVCNLIGSQPNVRDHFPLLAYLRPYLAAGAVGLSIFARDNVVTRHMSSAPLRYVAQISFALYVLHQLTYRGWLGSGDTVERYLKRPLSFLLAFAAAHLSTFYFERPLNRFGHRLASRFKRERADP